MKPVHVIGPSSSGSVAASSSPDRVARGAAGEELGTTEHVVEGRYPARFPSHGRENPTRDASLGRPNLAHAP